MASGGRLIVFEGGEGTGKSTQLRRLADLLTQRDVRHRTLREPGGTALGSEVRRILLHVEDEIEARAEALLFMASRAQLVAREIRPALERGERPTEEMEKNLDSLLGQVQSQSAYQRLVAAQENFDKLMLRVNQWIMDGMKKGAASPIITLG